MSRPKTAEAQWTQNQALASARIEGFEPSPEFLADSKALAAGEITEDQFRVRSLARAKRMDDAAGTSNG